MARRRRPTTTTSKRPAQLAPTRVRQLVKTLAEARAAGKRTHRHPAADALFAANAAGAYGVLLALDVEDPIAAVDDAASAFTAA